MSRMYRIYKDGIDTERSVGFYYRRFDYEDRFQEFTRLREDYPESEGYLLKYEDECVFYDEEWEKRKEQWRRDMEDREKRMDQQIREMMNRI
jgi:hypothetical protein